MERVERKVLLFTVTLCHDTRPTLDMCVPVPPQISLKCTFIVTPILKEV